MCKKIYLTIRRGYLFNSVGLFNFFWLSYTTPLGYYRNESFFVFFFPGYLFLQSVCVYLSLSPSLSLFADTCRGRSNCRQQQQQQHARARTHPKCDHQQTGQPDISGRGSQGRNSSLAPRVCRGPWRALALWHLAVPPSFDSRRQKSSGTIFFLPFSPVDKSPVYIYICMYTYYTATIADISLYTLCTARNNTCPQSRCVSEQCSHSLLGM